MSNTLDNLNKVIEAIEDGLLSYEDAYNSMVKVQGNKILTRGFTENLIKDLSVDLDEEQLKDLGNPNLDLANVSDDTFANDKLIDNLIADGYEREVFDNLSNWHGTQIFDDDYMSEVHEVYGVEYDNENENEEDDDLSYSDLPVEDKADILQSQLNIIKKRGDWRKLYSLPNAPDFEVNVADDLSIQVTVDIGDYFGNSSDLHKNFSKFEVVLDDSKVSSLGLLDDLEEKIYSHIGDFSKDWYVRESLKIAEKDDLSGMLDKFTSDAEYIEHNTQVFMLAFSGALNKNKERLDKEELRSLGNNVVLPLDVVGEKRIDELDNLKFKDYDFCFAHFTREYPEFDLGTELISDLDQLTAAPTLENLFDNIDNNFDRKWILEDKKNWPLLLACADHRINENPDAFKDEIVNFSYTDLLNKGLDELFVQSFENNQDKIKFNAVVNVIQNNLYENQQIELLKALDEGETLEAFVEEFSNELDEDRMNEDEILIELTDEIKRRSDHNYEEKLSNDGPAKSM